MRPLTEPFLDDLKVPENLEIGMMISAERARCATRGCDAGFAQYALGQSPFPVPAPVAEALGRSAEDAAYVSAVGIDALHEAVARFWRTQFGVAVTGDRIIAAPGAKFVLLMLIAIFQGPLLIPTPAWVGYSPLARLFHKEVIPLPTLPAEGYKLTPQALEAAVRALPSEQKLLVLNSPNNPTGAIYSPDELEQIAQVCRAHRILVIADEIYALTTYDPAAFATMAAVYPEGTFVVSGISKFASAGGYRLGVGILPDSCPAEQREHFRRLGAATYSNVTTPVQHAGVAAFSESPAMRGYIAEARAIHRIMGAEIHRRLTAIRGVEAPEPQGGFYLYCDLNAHAARFRARGLRGGSEVMRAMLAHPQHVAMLAGEECLARPDDYSFRVAFVDYDGEAAMAAYRAAPPATPAEVSDFFETKAPRMAEGLGRFQAWLERA